MTDEQYLQLVESLSGTGALVHRRKFSLYCKIVNEKTVYRLGCCAASPDFSANGFDTPLAAFQFEGLKMPNNWDDICVQAS